jgi:hypothetical protein
MIAARRKELLAKMYWKWWDWKHEYKNIAVGPRTFCSNFGPNNYEEESLA